MSSNALLNAGLCCKTCGRPFENPELNGMLVAVDAVWHRGEHIQVSPRQAEIMFELVKAYPHAVSHSHIFSKVWGSNSDVFDKILQVYMVKIRKKIGRLGLKIETIWGVGYKLVKL